MVADVTFGDASPAGRLPVTVPRGVGTISAFCNRKSTADRPHLFEEGPLWPFGHGLSDTTFRYDRLAISLLASVTSPLEELKGLRSVHLRRGEAVGKRGRRRSTERTASQNEADGGRGRSSAHMALGARVAGSAHRARVLADEP